MKQALELLAKTVPSEQAAIITSMPRGSLQIAQPAKLPEGLLRSYARQFHLDDRLTWQAILDQRPVAAIESLGQDHRFLREYLKPNGLAYAAAAPLRSPIIPGYAGAVHVYRTAEQGAFTKDDLRHLGETAKQIDQLVDKAHEGRNGDAEEPNVSLSPRPQAHVFAINSRGEQLLSPKDFAQFDARLRDGMVDYAKTALARLAAGATYGARIPLADSRGDLWNFRAVAYSDYPALGHGPVVFFCIQPNCSEWAAVRPADLQADPEIARLIPALKFMRQEFHRGPTLGEIARHVHLSPFHFHRRFAELLGLTPKHYLLECQINASKVELLRGRKELTQIAADYGFAHQSHFTSRFKQATGLTPTRWRRNAREALRQ